MKKLWKEKPSLDSVNEVSNGNMPGFLGIKFIEIGDDYVIASMPVNERTKQPLGRLHGGASVVLAETIGSMSAQLHVSSYGGNKACVGLSINASHIRGVFSGLVYAKATPLHLGRTTHVWSIEITDDRGKLVCSSRLTMAVIDMV